MVAFHIAFYPSLSSEDTPPGMGKGKRGEAVHCPFVHSLGRGGGDHTILNSLMTNGQRHNPLYSYFFSIWPPSLSFLVIPFIRSNPGGPCLFLSRLFLLVSPSTRHYSNRASTSVRAFRSETPVGHLSRSLPVPITMPYPS